MKNTVKVILAFTTMFIFTLSPMLASAETTNKNIIAGQGVFTSNTVEPATECSVKEEELKSGINDDESKGLFTGDGKIDEDKNDGGKISKIIGKLAKSVTNSFAEFFKVECGSTSFFSEIVKITTPLNLTNNLIIMQLIGITQVMALSMSVIIIGAFAIMYMTNYENLDPMKFVMRLVFSMVAVYFLPYLIQDILNLNNIMVYYISNTNITGNAGPAMGVMILMVSYKIITAMIAAAATTGGTMLIVICVAIVTISVYIVFQILKLILWWYTRMFSIFLLAVLGPFFVMCMALPQTADIAESWMKKLITEIFSQLIFTLAFVFFISVFANMALMQESMSIGLAGYIFMFYAGLAFFIELPAFAKEILAMGGGVKGNGLNNLQAAAAGLAGSMAGMAAKTGNKKLEKMNDKQDKINRDNRTLNKPGSSSAGSERMNLANAVKNMTGTGGKNGRVNMTLPNNFGGSGTGGSGGKGAGGKVGQAISKADDLAKIVSQTVGEAAEAIKGGKSNDDYINLDKEQNEIPEEMERDISNIIDNSPNRETAERNVKQYLAQRGGSKYDSPTGNGKNEMQLKQDANKLLNNHEGKMGMSVDAQKQIEKANQNGTLNNETFDAIIGKDIDNNPDLYAGFDPSVAGSKQQAIEQVKSQHGMDKKSGKLEDDYNKKGKANPIEITIGLGRDSISTNNESNNYKMENTRDSSRRQRGDNSKDYANKRADSNLEQMRMMEEAAEAIEHHNLNIQGENNNGDNNK